MSRKCKTYGKKITNMLRKIYWKKDFSGKRVLRTPFTYSFQYSFQIVYKRPLALFWVGVCWSNFFMFLKSAHNHSWAHIWVDAYSNKYSMSKLNRKNFRWVTMDHWFFGKGFWKYIIIDFYFHQAPSSKDVNLQTV